MGKAIRSWAVYADFIKRHWGWIAFGFLSLCTLSFLLFQKGVWTYVDASETGIYRPELFKDLSRYISALDTSYFFSHDQSQIGSYRIIPVFIDTVFRAVFGDHFGQIVYFFSFFLVGYVAFKKLLSYFFNKNASTIGALFFVFNPIALFFLYIPGYVYSYLAAVLIVIGVYEFFTAKMTIRRYSYLLVFVMGLNFLFIYTRMMGLYATLLVLLGAYFAKPLLKMAWQHKRRTITLAVTACIVLVPLFVAFLAPRITHESKYFAGAVNYADSQEKAAKDMYAAYQAEATHSTLVLREITSNMTNRWHAKPLFMYTSTLLFFVVAVGGFVLALYRQHRVGLYVSGILLVTVIVRLLGKFASEEGFAAIMYSYYPFVTNNLQWIFVLSVGCLAFLIALIATNKIGKKVIIPLVLFFLLVSVAPFVRFANNPRAQTFDVSQAPQEYKDEFYRGGAERVAASAYTDSHFSWTPYPVINFFSKQQWLMSGNVRVVGQDQADLNGATSILGEAGTVPNLQNVAVFNLKKIYLYKDAQSVSKELIAWAEPYDVATTVRQRTAALDADQYIVKEKDNPHFVRYGVKDNQKYEFNVYSPGAVETRDKTRLFSDPLDVQAKPMLTDNDAYGKKLSNSELAAIAKGNPSVSVDVKQSFYDQTRYYIKVTDFDPKKPFLLQLNKVYNPNWKVKWITKQDYERIKCSSPKQYPITQNTVCEFGGNPLDVRDAIRLGGNARISDDNHFEGNYVGNAWVANEDQLPDSSKEIYAMVVYEKQGMISLGFVVSWLAVIVPSGIALVCAVRTYWPVLRSKL